MPGLLNCPLDEEVIKYIENCEDFHIEGNKQKENVKQVEQLLESKGYSVRVKTKGREATLLFTPIWALNVTFQAAHALTTYNPDWVIYKAVFGSKIEVKYFGKES
ncbi:hypothetical protein [Sulfurimonas sp.]|uniref:hypothetical protein n=1 Tax=Sulfurimonas sp. TaxID=2022749 RepID=UPI0025EC2845|nr:hypothetical protein [Sulfurimonas sp.]